MTDSITRLTTHSHGLDGSCRTKDLTRRGRWLRTYDSARWKKWHYWFEVGRVRIPVPWLAWVMFS